MLAGVRRDAAGVLIGGFAHEVKAQSTLLAETLALIEGIELAVMWEKEKGRRVVTVESNCLTLLQALLRADHLLWEVTVLIKIGRATLSSLSHLSLTHCYCYRDQNKTAQSVVKTQLRLSLSLNWISSPSNLCWMFYALKPVWVVLLHCLLELK